LINVDGSGGRKGGDVGLGDGTPADAFSCHEHGQSPLTHCRARMQGAGITQIPTVAVPETRRPMDSDLMLSSGAVKRRSLGPMPQSRDAVLSRVVSLSHRADNQIIHRC
jgi:hypothetical protein